MKELFGLFAQIAISRKGPQDLPASLFLLAFTVIGYWLLRYILSVLMPPADHWRVHLLIEIVFTLVWYAVLLRVVGKPERFMQTATAIFSSMLLLTPPGLVAVHFWQGMPGTHALVAPLGLLVFALAIWTIRAESYVLKHALELPIVACVILTVLQNFTGVLLMQAIAPSPPVVQT